MVGLLCTSLENKADSERKGEMIYIWRNETDRDTIHLGVRNSRGYSIWATIFVDGAYDLFGLSFEQFQLITTKPRPIELSLEILGEEG